MPEGGPKPGELLLLGVAAHKAARLITKDRVTSPLRAPFVEYKKGAGEGEVEEEPRGTGMQEAVGDLLTCPYCLAVWIVTPLWFGMALAPRLTRFVAGILATVTVSDFVQRVYLKAKNWGDQARKAKVKMQKAKGRTERRKRCICPITSSGLLCRRRGLVPMRIIGWFTVATALRCRAGFQSGHGNGVPWLQRSFSDRHLIPFCGRFSFYA